jgi:hypothetical protein
MVAAMLFKHLLMNGNLMRLQTACQLSRDYCTAGWLNMTCFIQAKA